MKPTVETISLGCRLNAYETERMAELARQHATRPAVVINTCAVTGEAVRQSRQAIRRARKNNPEAELIVSGCAVQTDPDHFASMPEIDRLIGNADKLDKTKWHAGKSVTDVFTSTTLSKGPPLATKAEARAHLEVQNGCDHRCTFCIIPFGRGNARSKPTSEILREAQELIERGAREIVLTGVDLTSYGTDLGDRVTLADPLEAMLGSLPGNIRIRLSSIDGAEIDDRLFELLTASARVMPHVHLSLQSGDTMILKRMKRRHTREEAVILARRLKSARPEIALGADLIAGFPTETEEMFRNSLALIEDCQLAYVHVFPYSPRKGTPAARMPQLAREIIKDRAQRLRTASDQAFFKHLQTHLGTRSEALIEQTIDGHSLGKLPDFTEVMIEGAWSKAAFVPVTLDTVRGRALSATPISEMEKITHG